MIWVLRVTPKDRADQAVVDSQAKVDGVAAITPNTNSRWATLPRRRRSETSPTKDVVAWPLHSKARAGR